MKPIPRFWQRPNHGYCYLDFLDVWLIQALDRGDADAAGRYAREITHWARLIDADILSSEASA